MNLTEKLSKATAPTGNVQQNVSLVVSVRVIYDIHFITEIATAHPGLSFAQELTIGFNEFVETFNMG